MHLGDDAQCSQIDAPACTGKALVFEDWGNLIHWQRIAVTLPSELQSAPQLSLLVQGEYPVYEVYVNGQLIGSSGSMATRKGPQDARAIYNIPPNLARQGRLVIAIHSLGLQSANHIDGFVPTIAPLDRLQTVRDMDTLNYLLSSWLHYLCFAAMFGAGFVFLLLFSVNTRLHEYFWLGIRLCALFIFRVFELSSIVNMHVPMWLALVNYSFWNSIGALCSVEFVFSFLGRPVTKFFRAVEILCALQLLYLLILLPWPPSVFLPIGHIVMGFYIHQISVGSVLLSALSFLLLVPVCFRSKLPEMRWIGAATLFFAVEESNRMAQFIHLPSLPQDIFWHGVDIDLRGISNLLFAIVMLIAMTFRLRRIQNRNREVEQEMAAARSVSRYSSPTSFPPFPACASKAHTCPRRRWEATSFRYFPCPTAIIPSILPPLSFSAT